MTTYFAFRLGSVGFTLPEFETKLDESSSEADGEICMRGRHVFMGYLNELEKTVEILKPDGWLHTGDLGKLDSDGLLYVTGKYLFKHVRAFYCFVL